MTRICSAAPFVSLAFVFVAPLAACDRQEAARTAEAPAIVLTDTPPPLATVDAAVKPANTGALPPGHPPMGGTQRQAPPGPVDPNTPLPPGHPPVSGQAAPAGAPPMMPSPEVARETDKDLPLVLEGSGGLDELTKRQKMLPDALKADFETAFRLVFTLDRARRDATRAGALVATLLASDDVTAKASGHRLAGYLAINRGFDTVAALAAYREAIALDPNYGEAHYALAFTLAISDLGAGKTHFDRALELGVADTRNLRGQFYGAASTP